MKNTKKTAFLSVFLVICLLLASCSVPSGDVSQKDGSTHLEALVAKNGGVYLYEASSQALEQVASIDAEGTKASMSPDKKHIAYALPATAVEGETYLRLNIAVVNTETKAKKEISISSGGDLVYSTFWLDNSHVVVEAHLNPSVNVYSIVDIESGEKTDFQGTEGVSLGNGDILYIGGMNHFYPERLTGHICLNDKMTCEKDGDGNLLPDEVRLTKYGKFLRKTSLDEIPELINIFLGSMSIVGPRPLLVQYLPLYNERQKHRHDVRPGLTGLAQAKGRNAISFEERFELDLEYIENLSLKTDIQIIFLTIKTVLKREGISSETSETMEFFTGTPEEKEVTKV